MTGAGAGHAAGQNLSALRHAAALTSHVLIFDLLDVINAALPNLAMALTAATHGALGSLISLSHD